jgi:hypothetical protein
MSYLGLLFIAQAPYQFWIFWLVTDRHHRDGAVPVLLPQPV